MPDQIVHLASRLVGSLSPNDRNTLRLLLHASGGPEALMVALADAATALAAANCFLQRVEPIVNACMRDANRAERVMHQPCHKTAACKRLGGCQECAR